MKNPHPVATSRKPPPSARTAEPAADRGRTLRLIVWILAVLAALRVLVYCAAFPFFNNVDELYHFDLEIGRAHV